MKKKLDVKPFYVATKFYKIVNYFSFEEKNLGQFSKNYRAFYQKNCQKALQNMVLGSGIRDPDPGSRGQKGTGSRIRIRNTGAKQVLLVDPYLSVCIPYQSIS